MKENYAYITMATSQDYLLGLMTMWLSLKKNRYSNSSICYVA